MTPETAIALEMLEQAACHYTEAEYDYAVSDLDGCRLSQRAHEAALEQASEKLRAAAFDYAIAIAVASTRPVPWPISGSSPADLVVMLAELRGRSL